VQQVFAICFFRVETGRMTAKKTGKKYGTQGISWPDPALYEAAKARAEAQGRSLSNYIRELIKEDVARARVVAAAKELPVSSPSASRQLLGRVLGIPSENAPKPK
jgi:hypothetical protein